MYDYSSSLLSSIANSHYCRPFFWKPVLFNIKQELKMSLWTLLINVTDLPRLKCNEFFSRQSPDKVCITS